MKLMEFVWATGVSRVRPIFKADFFDTFLSILGYLFTEIEKTFLKIVFIRNCPSFTNEKITTFDWPAK